MQWRVRPVRENTAAAWKNSCVTPACAQSNAQDERNAWCCGDPDLGMPPVARTSESPFASHSRYAVRDWKHGVSSGFLSQATQTCVERTLGPASAERLCAN